MLPKPTGKGVFPPPVLTSRQKKLCRKLDSLHAHYKLKVKPSAMFSGAVFVAVPELQSNPDWMAQAANSLREILYPFFSRKVKVVPTNKKRILKDYGSVYIDDALIGEMGRVYGKLQALAHHGNIKSNGKHRSIDFFKLLNDFELVMLELLARQTDIHQEIDNILSR